MRLLILALSLSACGQGVDCRLLNGGWHPDIPNAVAAQCRVEK